MDDSKGRAYELQQAAVKCMRGILFCYMRQADKVTETHLEFVLSILTWFNMNFFKVLSVYGQ